MSRLAVPDLICLQCLGAVCLKNVDSEPQARWGLSYLKLTGDRLRMRDDAWESSATPVSDSSFPATYTCRGGRRRQNTEPITASMWRSGGTPGKVKEVAAMLLLLLLP